MCCALVIRLGLTLLIDSSKDCSTVCLGVSPRNPYLPEPYPPIFLPKSLGNFSSFDPKNSLKALLYRNLGYVYFYSTFPLFSGV
jgi:hypothetical protein